MIIIIILRDSKIYSMRPFFLSRVLGAKIPQAVTRREAHTLQSLRSLSLSTDTALYCGRAHPIMMYGTCQCPWGESVQKLLQVLAMATSRVDMSQHWTTSNFSSFCALEETDFFFFWEREAWEAEEEDYILFTRQWAIVVFCDCELLLFIIPVSKINQNRRMFCADMRSENNSYTVGEIHSIWTSRHIIFHFKPELRVSSASSYGFTSN